MSIKVKLRQKVIGGNRRSLYLDFYPPIPHPKTGKPTRREFLGLYILEKPNSVLEKENNKETLLLGEQIRQKRSNELNKPEVYTSFEKEQLRLTELGDQDFVEYFKSLARKRKASNHDNWMSCLNYLESFTGGTLKFSNLNEKFCNDFKEYLLTTKSQKSSKRTLTDRSASSYFNKVKATLKQAYRDGLIPQDLNAKIQPIKSSETQREYLTLEELNQLVKTPCNNDLLKRASLFSALTGLRFSDIHNLLQ